jgi:uncharacterized MAPEG superfamily protein
MTIALWCLVIAALIPEVIAISTILVRNKQLGSVDNKNPRAQYAQLDGGGARRVAAQANAWESLQVFTICVFVAHVAGADTYQSGVAAMIFIAMRLFHWLFYVLNLDVLRSLVFAGAMSCCMYLIYLSAIAVPVGGV